MVSITRSYRPIPNLLGLAEKTVQAKSYEGFPRRSGDRRLCTVLQHRVEFWIELDDSGIRASTSVRGHQHGVTAIRTAENALDKAEARLKTHLGALAATDLGHHDPHEYPLNELLDRVGREECVASVEAAVRTQFTDRQLLIALREEEHNLSRLEANVLRTSIAVAGTPRYNRTVTSVVAAVLEQEERAAQRAAVAPVAAPSSGWHWLVVWLLALMLGSWFLTITWPTIAAVALAVVLPLALVSMRSHRRSCPIPRAEVTAVTALVLVACFGLAYAVCAHTEATAIALGGGDPVTQIGDGHFISAGIATTAGSFDATLRHGAKIVAHVQMLLLLSIALPAVALILLRTFRLLRRLDGRFDVNL